MIGRPCPPETTRSERLSRRVDGMHDLGLADFHYPDGQVLTEDLALYSQRLCHKGDRLVRLGVDWLIFDRVDRAGVSVCLCEPASGEVEPVGLRARKGRGRG
jgi:hypothetical protein